MILDYDIRKLRGKARLEERATDKRFIEFAQEHYTEDDNDFYWWVLGLVDRLTEAGYDWQEAQDEIEELKEYIEDWTVKPNLGKHFDEMY